MAAAFRSLAGASRAGFWGGSGLGFFSVPVRHHVGYLPFQGRLNPPDATEIGRISLQCEKLNLKPVKKVQITFDPFHPKSESIRHIMFHFSNERVHKSNVKCVHKTEVVSDRRDPTFKAYLEDGTLLIFKTANLRVEEILSKFNDIVLPRVKEEKEVMVETKSSKKKKK